MCGLSLPLCIFIIFRSYNKRMRKYLSLLTAFFYLFLVTVSVLLCVNSPLGQTVMSAQKRLSVVIDAGHGGIDGGVTGKTTGVKESDLNLSISYILKDLFVDAGFLVTMTRATEFGVTDGINAWTKKGDMKKRREIIQETNPDFVLSIHQNALAFNRSIRGAQVFYAQGKETDKQLAVIMQTALNAVYQKHGVKPRNATVGEYYMLECTTAPSLIIECGFLSSPNDEKLLLQDFHKKQIANAIFTSVVATLS